MSDEKLTVSQKRKITEDWAREFPTLTVWKPMWLIRRHGPMVYGICLDGASRPDAYVPTVFAHCLAESFPGLSLNGYAPIPSKVGVPLKVTLNMRADSLGTMAETLRNRHPALKDGELSLDRLADHFCAVMKGEFGVVNRFQHGPYMALALSGGAVGDAEFAKKVIDRAETTMAAWPATALNIIGDRVLWTENLRIRAADPAALLAVVASEVEKSKLGSAPDVGLRMSKGLCDLTAL